MTQELTQEQRRELLHTILSEATTYLNQILEDATPEELIQARIAMQEAIDELKEA